MAPIRFVSFLSIVAFLAGFPSVAGAEMTSTNYTIYADTIGVNAGSFATSASYSLQDTTGDLSAMSATSTTYELRGGYQAMERGQLMLSISGASLDLGELDKSRVSTASAIAEVTSEAPTGFVLSISSVSGSMPASVADGAVTSGAEEYGFTATGPYALISGDVPVAAGTTIAAAGSEVTGNATTLTFKASYSGLSSPNTYSQTITLTVSANF